jgi:hypothetical protein
MTGSSIPVLRLALLLATVLLQGTALIRTGSLSGPSLCHRMSLRVARESTPPPPPSTTTDAATGNNKAAAPYSFVNDELRAYAMRLHTRDQAPREGQQAAQKPFTKWEVISDDYYCIYAYCYSNNDSYCLIG